MSALDMNPEIRTRWVAALRSGEYEQGTQVLCSPAGKRCCMGVLCDLAEKEGVTHLEYGTPGEPSYDREVAYLPLSVMSWAGLRMRNPALLVNDGDGLDEVSLAALNDELKWSFDQIADAIEGINALNPEQQHVVLHYLAGWDPAGTDEALDTEESTRPAPIRCVCGELIVPCPHNQPPLEWDHVASGAAVHDPANFGRPVPRADGSIPDPDPQDPQDGAA